MNILSLVLNDLKQTAANKVTLALLLVLPVLMISLLGYAMKPVFQPDKGLKKFSVLYTNQDPGPVGRSLDSFLHSQGGNLLELVPVDSAALDSQVLSGKYPVGISVPPDLSQRLGQGDKSKVEVVSSGRDQVTDKVVRSLLDSFAAYTNTQTALSQGYQNYLPGTQGDTASSRAGQNLARVQSRFGTDFVSVQASGPALDPFQFFAATMLVFFLLTTGMGVGTGIINERTSGVMTRINSSPIKRSEYLLGKILSNLVIALVQASGVILFTHYAFQVNWGSSPLSILFILTPVIFISSALGIIFASILSSAKALTSILSIVFWCMTFVSGGFTPVPVLDPVARFTVNKWAFNSLSSLMAGGTLSNITGNLLALFTTALILWLGAIALYQRRLAA